MPGIKDLFFGKKDGVDIKTLSREVLFLAEQSAETGIKVLPGKEWAFHYAKSEAERSEKLKGLLSGKYKADEVAADLRPDTLIYNMEDIKTAGLESVSARIRDLSAFVSQYDHVRFARFVGEMSDREINPEVVRDLYNRIAQTRVQQKMLKAYGTTGKRQMEQSIKRDSLARVASMEGDTPQDRVLTALKLDWMCDKQKLVSSSERDSAIAKLSGAEREVYKNLKDAYKEYVEEGSEDGYERLVKEIKSSLPKLAEKNTGPSQEMQELDKELEQFKKDTGAPGSEKDKAIPPDDEDEYITPPSFPGKGAEGAPQVVFEIEPGLGGYFAAGRKSYFDINSKTWSKKKKISNYSGGDIKTTRHKISGRIAGGLKSIPLPNGYALDAKTLQTPSGSAELFRDQNGCFYIKANNVTEFSIEFGEENTVFTGKPITNDTEALVRGALSANTEKLISSLSGSELTKAEQIIRYIQANHFYPGGGDLQAAQALQEKLRNGSAGEEYVRALDASEYLECYSANTLFVALARRANIPARLVVGHKIDKKKKGKSHIDNSTGHAWSEIWDGSAWRRVDATPDPKPEDKKDNDNKEKDKSEKADDAPDGGVDTKPDPKSVEEAAKEKKEQGESGEEKSPEDMKEAGEAEKAEAEKNASQAKDNQNKDTEARKEAEKKIDETKNFKEIEEAKNEIEKNENLFDESKKELEEKLEAKEEKMKEELKEILDQMNDDGFLDEEKRKELESKLDQKALDQLDKVREEIEKERQLYKAYEAIQEEIRPLVDQWFNYFVERLPRQDEVGVDEDSLTRQGAFNRKSVMRARNLIFGQVKNPRQINPSIKPRFMAKIMVDVSGSMAGAKLHGARKLLLFYSELFSRIEEEFGYIRFSIDTFSDSVKEMKTFKQEYDSPERYQFADGTKSTVKVRLMRGLNTEGGTNMLPAIKRAASELREETREYPEYASAFYFVGDGEDTAGNTQNLQQFMQSEDKEHGFGEHMRSAILIGSEAERRALSGIFGDEHTTVVSDINLLIEKSMEKFDEDLEAYLRTKQQ